MLRATVNFELLSMEKEQTRDAKEMRDWLARQEAFDERMARAVKPLVDRIAWGSYFIDLDSPRLPELVELIEGLLRRGEARLKLSEVREEFVDDDATQVEWFRLAPKTEFVRAFPEGKEWEALKGLEFPVGRADGLRPGTHLTWYPGVFVAARVKALIEQHGLTGVELLWIPDTSRYAAPQWYLPVAMNSLGRGIDHPWFDWSKRKGEPWKDGHARHPLEPQYRYGVSFLASPQRKAGAAYGEPVRDRLLALPSYTWFTIDSYRRVLRKHLPATGFAYCWSTGGGGHSRGLCCQRNVRDLLLEAGLAREEEFEGIEVLDEPYPGAEVPDELPGGPAGPGPGYTEEELVALREELAGHWAKFSAKPKPVRRPSLPRSLDLLKARKAADPDSFSPPLRGKALEKANADLPAPIPTAWEKVLKVCNGATIENCPLSVPGVCVIVSAQDLPAFQRQQYEWAHGMDHGFPTHYLHVVESQLGDFICLDPSSLTDKGDCRVLLISHETMAVEREWDSIAAFLEDLLEQED